jgi:hypothetical protein
MFDGLSELTIADLLNQCAPAYNEFKRVTAERRSTTTRRRSARDVVFTAPAFHFVLKNNWPMKSTEDHFQEFTKGSSQ